LLAFEGEEPVGWIAIAPRTELRRIERSRVTPRVDDEDVWVIPCITVRPSARGRGIAVALIRAAVAYAARWGRPRLRLIRARGAREPPTTTLILAPSRSFAAPASG
jgi:GNAT superfamily N-acetyltransferase